VALALLMLAPMAAANAAATDTAPLAPLNITVSPDAQEVVTKPGVPVTTSFQVRNNGLQTEQIKATVKTFKASGQNGVPQLLDPKPSDDFIHWVSLSPTFTAEPNVWVTYKLTISPPKTAAFGYYYAINFARANQNTASKGNTFLTSINGLILLDVKAPGEVRQSSLVEFSTPNKLIEFLPQNFTVRMQNTGNVHVAPHGNIFLYKGKKSVGIIDVNPSEGNILPGSYRKYTTQWKNGTPVYKTVTSLNKKGQPNDKTTLSWDNFSLGKLRYGKYTAQLEMIYNNGKFDVPLTAELNFWVVPWRIIAVLLVILLLILAGLWALFVRPLRARVKRKNRGNVRFH
jgi:hypothetical protein